MVPDSEFSEPTLTVSPEVSTQDSAPVASVSLALLPQAETNIEAVTTTLPAISADLLDIGRGSLIWCLSFDFGASSELWRTRVGVESAR